MISRNVLNGVVVATTLLASGVQAGELTGYIALDHRSFLHGEQHQGQELGSGPTLVAEPEWYHVSDDDKHTFTAKFFGRIDPYDSERNHVDVRQLDWLYAEDDYELRIGFGKVFWGVIESQHLVDVINQTDSVEDTDGEDKLGQPMIQYARFTDAGTFRFFYLPYFRERTFPGVEGRLRGALPIATDNARYTHSAEEWHPDIAFRYTHTLDAFDVGISHFHGTSREPTIRFENNRLTPVYEVIDQTGLDLQYTDEGWLWKFEGIGRAGHGDAFLAASLGLEYTFYTVIGDADVGVLAEYHRDGRDMNAPATLFDNDIFVGSRVVLNDIYDTEFLGGGVYDTNTQGVFLTVEAARRLNDNWKVEFDARFFSNQERGDLAYDFQRDDFIQLRLARYF